ncbi:MAG TPA: NAD(P)-binding domain-containing protein [Polyangiaceae bacterium]|jgi:cation diffusion facilitator CzcD-associated flavoprotein CzcO
MTDVAIVGAGAYGVSVASHLKHWGLKVRVFGSAMASWRPMPRDLYLKSFGFATSIGVPRKGYDLPGWLASRGLETLEPISYADFCEYALWVQSTLVPEVEPHDVTALEPASGGGFGLTLATGARAHAERVVVAVGIGPFQQLPRELAELPPSLVCHSFGNYDFRRFAGQDVAIIGAGQSALEMAVLAHEQGARAHLLAHKPPFFYGRTPPDRSWLDRVRNPLTVLGAGRNNWVIQQLPGALHLVPEERRVRFTKRYLGPSGAWWLRDRFEGNVSITAPMRILSARATGDRAILTIVEEGRPARERPFAFVICGSGFDNDLERLSFLDPALRARIARIENKVPRLNAHFESSVPGLYFVGPISALSFGPLFRFVCGTSYAGSTVARHAAMKKGLFAALEGRVTTRLFARSV